MINRRALFTILAGGAATPVTNLLPVSNPAEFLASVTKEAAARAVEQVGRQFPDMLEDAKSRYG